MKTKKNLIYLSVFVIILLIQLGAITRIIIKQEDVVNTGSEFKFKCRPVDPYDIFRGRYVSLNFDEKEIQYEGGIQELDKKIAEKGSRYNTDIVYFWNSNIKVKIYLSADENGFAKLSLNSSSDNDSNYIFVRPYRYDKTKKTLFFNLPFNKFFTNEFNAPILERGYNNAAKENTKDTFAIVAIKNGKYAVKDLYLENLPSKEFVKEFKKKAEEEKSKQKK